MLGFQPDLSVALFLSPARSNVFHRARGGIVFAQPRKALYRRNLEKMEKKIYWEDASAFRGSEEFLSNLSLLLQTEELLCSLVARITESPSLWSFRLATPLGQTVPHPEITHSWAVWPRQDPASCHFSKPWLTASLLLPSCVSLQESLSLSVSQCLWNGENMTHFSRVVAKIRGDKVCVHGTGRNAWHSTAARKHLLN